MSDNTTQSIKKKDVIVTRVFDAPIEQVWKAWTDSEEVMKWWQVEGFTSSLAQIDFREGGTSLVSMRSPDGYDIYTIWTYRKIVPMERIEYINNMADKYGNKVDPVKIGMPPDFPRDQLHTVTFKVVNSEPSTGLRAGKTEITVTEYNWTVGQMMEMSKMGLEQCLDRMAASLATA